ncbi:sensor protein PilS [Bacterioplanes sanyensis]|uniref:sensor histidine kinase n=1 Tax=Bacterioplanes sanyensis TaxID=1249553 RepID=UPI0016765EF8|nr:ATP-binding protein [Bacterioplanes sanyensis]GGY46157.1 sensor protein PilS [Bacterioplanes sanyensis]
MLARLLQRFSLSPQMIVRGNRLLRLYSYYSLFLALLLTVIDSLDQTSAILGRHLPDVFLVTVSVYVMVASIFVVIANRGPNIEIATAYVFIETAILALLMHSSGTMTGGFSSLILVAVVVANLLVPGLFGYAVAAWTTLAVLFFQHVWPQSYDASEVIESGIYGFLCFLLAGVTQALSARLNSALDLATNQAQRIRRLQKLSQEALFSLPDGVIACDQRQQVLFFNAAAAQFFPLQQDHPLPPELLALQDGDNIDRSEQPLKLRRLPLGDSGDALLLLEDARRLAAEAQQVKLASLGRLTASIAHEVRNPLSAMRQAAQLLAETPYLEPPERKLTDIIEQHCMRINRTVEDILQLSRRRPPAIEELRLLPWLEHFKQQFCSAPEAEQCDLVIRCEQSLLIAFDPGHLQQILHNLCANGLRYASQRAAEGGDAPKLMLVARQVTEVHAELDVIDNGGGVAPEQRPHLFEPFYTTEHNGTGLGLYLCRELCEANHASIYYQPQPDGSCFRLSLQTRLTSFQ